MPLFSGEAITACFFVLAMTGWCELLIRCRNVITACGCLYGMVYCGASAGFWLVRWADMP